MKLFKDYYCQFDNDSLCLEVKRSKDTVCEFLLLHAKYTGGPLFFRKSHGYEYIKDPIEAYGDVLIEFIVNRFKPTSIRFVP